MRENAGAAGVRLSPEAVQNLDAALGNLPMSAVFGVESGKRS